MQYIYIFDEMESELKADYREKLKEWQKDEEVRRIYLTLRREYFKALQESRDYMNKKYKEACGEKDAERKEWLIWQMTREKNRQNKLEKEIRRCNFYLNTDKEKKELNIDLAKEYPIGDLISTKATYKKKNRAAYLCPFHNEKTGSFVWFVKENRFHCFGCGKNGDVIDFVIETTGVSFVEAVKKLI